MRKLMLLAMLLPAFAKSQVNLSLGLKANYTFTGNANDISGSGFHGNVQGATLTTDRFGNPNSAYYFDGIDDRIVVTDNGALSTPAFSVVYYFLTEATTYQNCIGKINYTDGNGGSYNSGIYPTGTRPYFATIGFNGNCNSWVTSTLVFTTFGPNAITLNQWHCVVNTFSNGIEKQYIDGVLVSQANTSFPAATYCPNTNFVMGSWWSGDPYRFKGKMDDVRYYDRALTAEEAAAFCNITQPISCNNWLNTPSAPSYAAIGDLDIPGNQLTVEATFNRTAPWTGSNLFAGNLVSKHQTFQNANYLLRPNSAEITTSNGYFIAEAPCGIELNKNYHVAMTYDGATLKFYRNGFLMRSVPASGTLYQNNFEARIGWLDHTPPIPAENFIGYINEVRLWNVARTQTEIRNFMSTSIPSPTTQAGLRGYYTFDNLLNKQGNASFNANLVGPAAINRVNPQCDLVPDTCGVVRTDSIIVNKYTPVLSLDVCKNSITVENAAEFNIGDTVLMIQMKGAVIDSTNTNNFGNITDIRNAGNYELNYVKSKIGNVIELRNVLLRQYDLPTGKVQLVRVPYYINADFDNKILTCLPWDGNKGGVLAINVRDALTLNANIDISARGFRGGRPIQNSNYVCDVTSFYETSSDGSRAAAKGEGIVNSNRLYGRGKLANGGGGGNSTNSGGAGGGNAGAGGAGGKQYQHVGPACSPDFTNGGIGGLGYIYTNAANKIFLGGGGGAGHDNEGITTTAGNGGGIAIINAGSIIPNGNRIISNGGTPINLAIGNQEDGRSGGGAGGTILINYTNPLSSTLLVDAKGGNGDISRAANPYTSYHGPGGGGGGGIIWTNKPTYEANFNTAFTGGVNGMNINLGYNTWGSTPGTAGNRVNSLVLPVSTVLFKPNIDSVRFTQNPTACFAFNFNGLGYTNTNPVTTWQWFFGDAGTANTQNTSHTYAAPGTYNVKLVVTDANGCKDSITRTVLVEPCGVIPVSCNNWLNTPAQPSYANIGDLDITGNKITIEANFVASFNDGGNGNLVSKHSTFTDVNYLLRPYSAEITTSNGYFQALSLCPVTPNKVYHAAMVYDGSTLKLYRNGFVIAQVNATGNLVQNDWKTWIGFFESQHLAENFRGFINEVRIWNVARTQNDIRANMGQGLPNPTTQTGLLAYYTFDNLINKQGNATWNAALGGGATINRTVPDCNFIVDSCNINPAAVPCNNWLNTPAPGSYAEVGDLDVGGNQVTVEAVFNRTTPYTGGDLFAGNLVSKHNGPATVNYLLRPNSAEITTSNGYFIAQAPCGIELNKTYHVAMVYDGTSLKFYRNGFLMSQTAVTGNLFQNNLRTRIGWLDFNAPNENFIGYINEVRIWNVARTQNQLQASMFSTLASPATQAGLLGYYTFDNLLNKQGNASFNALLAGGATINQTNPVCTYTTDSCGILPADSVIVNHYTPALSLDICKNNLTVQDATAFNIGDTVLLIQMKGAVIDSTNSAAFGNITDYGNAGNYEFNYVKSKSGNTIELKNILMRQYDLPDGKVQLVRVPYYINTDFGNKVLTCLPWDGNKGGILAINVRDTIKLDANVDVSGRGFEAGPGVTMTFGSNPFCGENNYYYSTASVNQATAKGNGIASLGTGRSFGKGAAANGGGGGNAHNTGGGGGGNGGAGGTGGRQFGDCPSIIDNGGRGGRPLVYNNVQNKIFMGGSGGSGQANSPGGYISNGGRGGGIIILQAGFIKANTHSIKADGSNYQPANAPDPLTDGHDGKGGGGAAGTVLASIDNYLDPVQVSVKGGKGGDITEYGLARIGPGGGGGGGTAWFKQNALPSNAIVTALAGPNGVNVNFSNDPWGSTPGSNGLSVFSLNIPVSTAPFKTNIDSVRFNSNRTACRSFDFNGLAYVNTAAVATWEWHFGDGNTAATQNTAHTYANAGTFDVKLMITDLNGCKDSVTRTINTNTILVEAGNPASYCSNTAITHQLNGSGDGISYNWQPAAFLDDNTLANPTATISVTTKFYLTQNDAFGCSAIDSVTITVNPVPLVNSFPDTAFCANASLQLNASGAATYTWSPAGSVSNPNIADPVYTGTTNQTMTVTGTNAEGCSASSSFDVTIKTLPTVTTIPDATICNTQSITLTTTGAVTYSWSPPVNLSDPTIASPVFSGSTGNTYTVTGTGINGCSNTDMVVITTRAPAVFNAPPAATVCLNNSVTLNGNNGTGVSYAWSPANTLNSSTAMNPVATPTATGTTTYTVVISEAVCNSSNTFNVNVWVNPLPGVDVSKSNDLDCAIRTSTLTASGAAQYSWSPTATLSSGTGTTTIASPTTDTKYVVTGTDNNGCINKDSVMVLVKGTNSRFDIPNAFTPDGDGKNDCFGVKHWGDATAFQFMIFNRWGEKVFETNNINQCWDGRYKGQPADIGGYVYYIRSTNLCGEMIKKGNVILIR